MLWIKKPKKRFEFKEPIFIYGIGGGMGNVAKIVGDFLIKHFKVKRICKIYSDALPDEVISNKNGVIDSLRIDLYKFSYLDQDFIIISGVTQPLDPIGRYELADKLMKFASSYNCKLFISLGGYGMELEPEEPKIYIAGSKKELVNELINKCEKDLILYSQRNIVGLSGLMVLFGKYYNVDSIILLAETYATNQIFGYNAARKILVFLSKMYNFEYDLEKFRKKAKKIKEMISVQGEKPFESLQSPKGKDIYYFG